jgi:hypothetical protein
MGLTVIAAGVAVNNLRYDIDNFVVTGRTRCRLREDPRHWLPHGGLNLIGVITILEYYRLQW